MRGRRGVVDAAVAGKASRDPSGQSPLKRRPGDRSWSDRPWFKLQRVRHNEILERFHPDWNRAPNNLPVMARRVVYTGHIPDGCLGHESPRVLE
jgi:hypothetical protein